MHPQKRQCNFGGFAPARASVNPLLPQVAGTLSITWDAAERSSWAKKRGVMESFFASRQILMIDGIKKRLKNERVANLLSRQPFFGLSYIRFPIFFIAFATFSVFANAVRRKYSSPEGPNPTPGVPTIWHSFNSLSKNSHEVILPGVSSQM